MSLLKACLKSVLENWPVVKAGFNGLYKAPWEDNVIIGATKKVDQAGQGFQMLMAPDVFYQSEVGKPLGEMALVADAEFRIARARFVESNKEFLSMIDPVWDGKGGKYDDLTSKVFEDVLRGKTKLEDVPASIRPSMANVKGFIHDLMTKTFGWETRVDWDINSDVIKPTIGKLFDPKNPNAGAYSLLHLVPKETYLEFLDPKKAATIPGVDWLRAAVPLLIHKNQFDPVITAMREALPKLPDLEKTYTESLINRIVGKKPPIEKTVDSMINTASHVMMGKVFISPAAKVASGMTRMLYDGLMLYNPGMAFMQFLQGINILATEGLAPSLSGLATFSTKIGREMAAERSMLSSMDKFYYNSKDKGALAKGLEKFEHAGYWLFDNMENFVRGWAYHAGLSRFMTENKIKGIPELLALRKGTTDQKELFRSAVMEGLGTVKDTQFLYGIVHSSPYLSTPLAKLVGGQFTSFPLRQSELFIKQWRKGDKTFPLRFLAYTGMASYAAYHGLGLAIGEQLGGGGSLPIAEELWKEGKQDEAIWAGIAGFVKFLPETYSLKRGLTPFGGFLFDTMALLGNKDPEEKWANFGRSASNFIPASLQIRRLTEAALVQYVNQGQRFKPKGAVESSGIATALSLASKEMFGEEIPGVPSRYTGAFVRKETPMETAKATLGLRGREVEMESRIMEINQAQTRDIRQGTSGYAQTIVQALLHGKPEDFDREMKAAMQSGLFVSGKSLHDAIEGAMRSQLLTSAQREQRNAPKAAKLQRLLENQ